MLCQLAAAGRIYTRTLCHDFTPHFHGLARPAGPDFRNKFGFVFLPETLQPRQGSHAYGPEPGTVPPGARLGSLHRFDRSEAEISFSIDIQPDCSQVSISYFHGQHMENC